MKIRLVYAVVVLAIHLATTHGVRKCDKKIVEKIEKNRSKECTGVTIKDLVSAKKLYAYKTTSDYYPKGTICAYTLFQDDEKSTILRKIINGTQVDEYVTVYVKDGVVIDKITGIKRYYVYCKGNVRAWYKCSDGAQAKPGKPEGGITVGKEKNKCDLKTAENRLKSIGMKLTNQYICSC